uniref:Uncharacterized protein n=1 Tax=Entomoneis paludosa TaxID=265537 RepID=A0A7S3DSI1_9STRA|mmetsp:Transcript_33778/g.70213  ORF Transcript_33778/g.70213 Transcript_33778/m.70213 type:complete len:356 (+) Transcript_33778:93-1160(+)
MEFQYNRIHLLWIASAVMSILSSILVVEAFQPKSSSFRSVFLGQGMTTTSLSASKRVIVGDRHNAYNDYDMSGFDPLGIAADRDTYESQQFNPSSGQNSVPQALSLASIALLSQPSDVVAKEPMTMDPTSFQPVCPTSDGIYRALQSTTEAIVGAESFQEYGPLIAGGLLRVRLEFCVVESFFNEAIGPFIAKNGVSWVLPFHETVETFLAGTVFAFAATFILLGSTKLVTVAITYTDFLLGVPSRLFGGFFYDRALGKPVTLDVGFGPFKTRLVGPPEEEEEAKIDIMEKGPASIVIIGLSGAVKLFGQALRILREVFDAIDIFVGRYLVVWATGYVLIKFLHYKVFPDFPNIF